MKIACLKFAGLGSGGTEKYLQTFACVLKKKHDVDFYYTNNAPRIGTNWKHPENCPIRKQFVESHGITTIPIHVDIYDNNNKTWIGTNVWDVFDPKKYDAVQTARYGFPEFPFTDIRGTKLIDSVHGDLCDPVSQVDKSILLCRWQADIWARSGGNVNKMEIVPSLVYVPDTFPSTVRQDHGIPEDAFVYGVHQRNDDGIFSPAALLAYSQVQNDNTYFVILGGCSQHRTLAKDLKLKNVIFLDFTSKAEDIHNFLSGIDVYAHSRSDGEVCSASIIEALYHGLPVVTHPAQNMGHAEQIEGCGRMAHSLAEYADEMSKLRDKNYYEDKSERAKIRYKEKYCYKTVEKKILDIYDSLLL